MDGWWDSEREGGREKEGRRKSGVRETLAGIEFISLVFIRTQMRRRPSD